VGIEQLLGVLCIVGGFIGTATFIRKQYRPASWWPLSSSVVAMALGVLLLRSPMQGALTLTIVMMVLFIIALRRLSHLGVRLSDVGRLA
jgi:uncharacterized membrane protein HdeD (DUF308 family)